ncbi:MAG: hypothetical protein G8345_02490 [Magnetococcales bacterium]|nr:hypothetical protein [Magnetococcales bacterium]NGZ25739.1 hypothetical protein [Magnetococcales bacterium]
MLTMDEQQEIARIWMAESHLSPRQRAAHFLSAVLLRRFPPLPEWVEERLQMASMELLKQWCLRVFQVQQLEKVFDK